MRDQLRAGATTAALLFGLNIPLITTVHPEHVIDDPAMMFAFGGALTVLSCLVGARNLPSEAAVASSVSSEFTFDLSSS